MRVRRTLSTRIMLYYILLNGIVLILSCGILIYESGHVLESEVTDYTEKTIEQASRLLDSSLTFVRARLVRLAASQGVVNCLSMGTPRYEATLEYEREMSDTMADIDLFTPVKDILVLGANGYRYNSTNRANLKSDYDFTACDWFQEAMGGDGGARIRMESLHLQDYYRASIEPTACHENTISFSMSVLNGNYEPVGAVIATFDLEKLGKLFISSNYEENGKIALLDPQGRICTQNDNGNIGETLGLEEDRLAALLGAESGHFTARIDKEQYLVCHTTSALSGWKLVSYIPVHEIQGHSTAMYKLLVPAVLICMAFNILLAFFYTRSVQKPLRRLMQNIERVDAGNPRPISAQYEYEEIKEISEHFNALMERINALIQKDYITQIELGRFELYALQAQINPHFLFNTLQFLQTEILYGNLEQSNDIILTLSQILRYLMSNGESQVTVGQEVAYLERYLSLFVRKYDGRLKTEIRMDPAAEKLTIPKLILQPVVENCIRYAVENRGEECRIGVRVEIDGEDLYITIQDNGSGIDPKRLEEVHARLNETVDWHNDGIGLANVNQRIRSMYGDRYGLTIESDSEGTTVILHLPVRRS